MILGVEHIAIASINPHKLADWYVGILEFKIFSTADTAVFIQAPNRTLFEIFSANNQQAEPGQKDTGLRHIAIAVDNFEAAYARLREAGIRFETEPYEASGNTVAFFRDPDGNLLHLLFRPSPIL